MFTYKKFCEVVVVVVGFSKKICNLICPKPVGREGKAKPEAEWSVSGMKLKDERMTDRPRV